MCGITGWMDWERDLSAYTQVIEAMTDTLAQRGPDASGTYIHTHCVLGHRRLSVIDPANGAQPMTRHFGERTYTIVYNGELYNAKELREELENRGYHFYTNCDTEVLLLSYVEWGKGCVERLNGIFAFAVWSDHEQELFLARDRLGVKPLFYFYQNGTFIFASEPKAILAHPQFHAQIDRVGLAEIFALGPARTPGHGIYRHMHELLPGYGMIVNRHGLSSFPYWKLVSMRHEDDEETTAEKVKELLQDTVKRQLVSDVPICLLLSGGLDSSALTAFAAQHYKEQGLEALTTYSIDYIDNDMNFRAHDFQPNSDRPWIERMRTFLGTDHRYVEVDTPELVDALKQVVIARDLPGMADIDSSLYLFCKKIKEDFTVAVSGEAADEIFGGYPWFHREDALQATTFPWSLSVKDRERILAKDIVDWIKPEQYCKERYEEALAEVPYLTGEEGYERRIREISYLNITRFMPTLLDRKDRMSMAVGLEVRVPYCDHRLVEYVWNIPWSMKMAGGREKGILRKALRNVLPNDVLERKKSPYPKTYNPTYTKAVKERLREVLHDHTSPLRALLNVDEVMKMINANETTTHIPWFGQLMSGLQLFAYLLQVDLWLRHYRVAI